MTRHDTHRDGRSHGRSYPGRVLVLVGLAVGHGRSPSARRSAALGLRRPSATRGRVARPLGGLGVKGAALVALWLAIVLVCLYLVASGAGSFTP